MGRISGAPERGYFYIFTQLCGDGDDDDSVVYVLYSFTNTHTHTHTHGHTQHNKVCQYCAIIYNYLKFRGTIYCMAKIINE